MPLTTQQKNFLRRITSSGAAVIGLDTLLNNVMLALPGATGFSVAAEGSNAIVTTIQLNDIMGDALTEKRVCTIWISDTAAGIPTATVPDGAVSIGTGVVRKVHTTKVYQDVISDANGIFTISVGESTAKSFYLNVEHKGKTTSQIITFA